MKPTSFAQDKFFNAMLEKLENRRLLSSTLFHEAPAVEAPVASEVLRNAAGEIVRLPGSAIGLNGVSTVAVNLPFNDVAKHNNGWISGPVDGSVWDDGRSLPLTEDGYPAGLAPGQAARSPIFQDTEGFHPTGEYVVEWDGAGDVQIRGQHIYEKDTGPDPGPNRKIYVHNTAGNIFLNIIESDPADPVRNIRVWLPDREDAPSRFTDEFKANLADHPVLRFMDWNVTNGNTDVEWSDRPQLSDAHWGWEAGVPYEVMIDLANETGKDIWINVPHAANDDYVAQLARLFNARLNPELDVWVEYSNETWNSAGPFRVQFDHVAMLAEQWGISHDAAHGRRSAEIFAVFQTELGGVDRMVRVIAGQTFNPGGLGLRIDGAGAENVDVAGVAYYFTSRETGEYINANAGDLDYDEVFDRIAADTVDAADQWANAAFRTQQRGIPLIAYEGNQHLDRISAGGANPHPNLVPALQSVTRHPRMEQAYRNALEAWEDAGGTMPTAYTDVAKWNTGQWGHKEYYNQPNDEATLNRALLGWVEEHRNGFFVDGGNVLVGGTRFEFEQGQSVTIRMDAGFASALDEGDLVLTNLDTGVRIDINATHLVIDTERDIAAFSFAGFEQGILPDGNYRATLSANAAVDGNNGNVGPALATDVTLDFFVLAGDLDRDRDVDLFDALTLQRNFGDTDDPVFSQGDLNYDGDVDLFDALILQRNFGQTLPPAGSIPPSLFAGGADGDSDDDDTSPLRPRGKR
ncbi:MAG: hypothetical protein AAGD32_00780 [Planctomycetota bacterium]